MLVRVAMTSLPFSSGIVLLARAPPNRTTGEGKRNFRRINYEWTRKIAISRMLRRSLLRPSVSFDPSYSPFSLSSFVSIWVDMPVAFARRIARFLSAWWSCFNHRFHDDSDEPSDTPGLTPDLIRFDPFTVRPVIYLGQPLLFFRRADATFRRARKEFQPRKVRRLGATFPTDQPFFFSFILRPLPVQLLPPPHITKIRV